MRIRPAAIAAVLLLTPLAAPAGAGTTYTITEDFSSMAGFAGLVVDQGKEPTTPFELDFGSVAVLGPAQAAYAGSIGLAPAATPPPFSASGSSVALENGGQTGDGPAGPFGTILVSSISATFAPDASGTLDWSLTIGDGPTPTHTWDASISGATTESFAPTGPMTVGWHAPAVILTAAPDDGAQILSIAVTYAVEPAAGGAVPEPSGLALAGIALAGAAVASVRRTSGWYPWSQIR